MTDRATVTCGHCEQAANCLYDEQCPWKTPTFFCETDKTTRRYHDPICDRFILRTGLYTDRWYPGKPER